MNTRNEHAIVLGGSMAGLLAARVLSEHFARVTLVERDHFPEHAEPRKGVPQSRHLHALLAKGLQVLHGFFPDLKEALLAGGAYIGDPGMDLRWHHFGGYKVAVATDMAGVYVSRPFLEGEVRRRVLALPNVTALQGYDVEGLVASADRAAVTGATIHNRAVDWVEHRGEGAGGCGPSASSRLTTRDFAYTPARCPAPARYRGWRRGRG